MNKVIGKLRPSQLIHYHAPGSIVDLLDDSVMITAADDWKIPYSNRLREQRIEGFLNLDHLYLISNQEDKIKVTATPFPKWRICPVCGMMNPYAEKNCFYCKKDNKEIKLYPARFIVVCEKGHISDFPWIEWVHENKGCTSDTPVLKYKSKGHAGSLSDIIVSCVKCKKKRSLGKIMNEEELQKVMPNSCTGERPWLNDKVNCSENMRTSLRNSSNIYTPTITSVLSIPLGNDNHDELKDKVEHSREQIGNFLKLPIGEDQKKNSICIMLGIKTTEFQKAMGFYHRQDQTFTYDSIRRQEWHTIMLGNVNDTSNTGFKSEALEVPEKLKHLFQKVIRIDKLKEIRVLQGFTRLYYPDPFSEDEHEILPIMKNKQKWLPAIEVLGEGIYFEFNEATLLQWEKNKTLFAESNKIFEKYNNQREQLDYKPRHLLPRHLLIHTFSHIMIKEFAAHSGYATTALRERLYCSDEMKGVLIYTASSDSEGSLGGLIELTDKEKLIPILYKALEQMEYCSSDPHCADGDYKMQTSVNGAACHSCCYVSETSCEWNNQLLDRRLLSPILDYESLAYFNF